MNFTYENLGTNTYLVYKIQPEDCVDNMSLGMITNNKISGLAPTTFLQMNEDKYIKYNVSAKVSVKQFFNGPVNRKRLLGVCKGIVDAMLSAEEYMLDVNAIILDLDYIFADVSTCETTLICLPLQQENTKAVNMGEFFKNMIFTTQFDQTENCDHVAKLINYLNSNPVFSMLEFKKVIESIEEMPQKKKVEEQVPVQKQERKPEVQPEVRTPKQQTVVEQPTVARPMPAEPVVPKQETKTNPEEKKLNMLWLLRNYNKENAAAYKAQKEAKKGTPVAKEPKKKKEKNTAAAMPTGFAIPGQQPTVQAEAPSQQAPQPIPQGTVQQKEQNPVTPIQQAAYTPRPVPQGQPMNFGETTVLGGGGIGETTVLNAAMLDTPQVKTPHLIRCKNQEKVSVGKPVFRIGKERSYVDYFIGDNSGISRSHANIVTREGRYYVVDTNSTNHTFVNGSIIQSNQEVEIQDGDKLRFANEDFEFRLC